MDTNSLLSHDSTTFVHKVSAHDSPTLKPWITDQKVDNQDVSRHDGSDFQAYESMAYAYAPATDISPQNLPYFPSTHTEVDTGGLSDAWFNAFFQLISSDSQRSSSTDALAYQSSLSPLTTSEGTNSEPPSKAASPAPVAQTSASSSPKRRRDSGKMHCDSEVEFSHYFCIFPHH
jgi:hypothetical protein